MAKQLQDSFANIAFLEVKESSAGVLTFAQLQLANNLMSEKVALVIHRIDWWTDGLGQTTASNDTVTFGLSLTDRLTSVIDPSQPELLAWHQLNRLDLGTAASGLIIAQPTVDDFSGLPSGGILVPADRLYIGVQGFSLSGVCAALCRLFYTVRPISVNEYWELIEARRIMTT